MAVARLAGVILSAQLSLKMSATIQNSGNLTDFVVTNSFFSQNPDVNPDVSSQKHLQSSIVILAFTKLNRNGYFYTGCTGCRHIFTAPKLCLCNSYCTITKLGLLIYRNPITLTKIRHSC